MPALVQGWRPGPQADHRFRSYQPRKTCPKLGRTLQNHRNTTFRVLSPSRHERSRHTKSLECGAPTTLLPMNLSYVQSVSPTFSITLMKFKMDYTAFHTTVATTRTTIEYIPGHSPMRNPFDPKISPRIRTLWTEEGRLGPVPIRISSRHYANA